MKTIKSKIILMVALVASALNALAKSDNLVSEARTSKPYHYINIKGDMNIKIVQEEMSGVSVEGTGYQIDNTITMLQNDTLFVFQTNVRKKDSKTFITINVENIALLEASGNTKVDCSDLINTDFLTVRAYDGAQIKLNVRALKVDSKATGCSVIDISGISASSLESIDGCGIIDSHMLDVLDHKINSGYLCCGY